MPRVNAARAIRRSKKANKPKTANLLEMETVGGFTAKTDLTALDEEGGEEEDLGVLLKQVGEEEESGDEDWDEDDDNSPYKQFAREHMTGQQALKGGPKGKKGRLKRMLSGRSRAQIMHEHRLKMVMDVASPKR